MKKALALLLALTMVCGLVACTTPAATGGTAPAADAPAAEAPAAEGEKQELPAPWKLGMPDRRAASADPTWAAIIAQVELLVGIANGEIVYLTGAMTTPEGILENVDQAIAQDCDAIMFMPVTDSILPNISQKCQEAGLYFASWFRKVQDPEVLALLEANPYWCGWTIEKEFEEGYKVTEYLASQGVTQVAFYGQEVGDACSDMREAGMRAAAKELGIEVVAEVRNLGSTAEITQAFESCIASFPDLNGLVMISSYVTNTTEAMAEAIATANKTGEIKLGTLDLFISQAELFDAGKLDISAGGQHILNTFLTAASLVNFVTGTPLDPDGKPNYTEDSYVYVHNGDEVREFFSYYGGDDGSVLIYNEDEIKSMALKWFNPALTQQDFYNLGLNWGLEDLKSRHG